MKIGIMTFWWSEDNYGQLLQCYALQRYLRDRGHDAYLIRYDPRKDTKKMTLFERIIKGLNPFKLTRFIINYHKKKKILFESKNCPRYFKDFRKQYIAESEKIYYSYKELCENPPDADMYIVGSDQVWNFGKNKIKRIKNLIHAYFLNFGSNSVSRISYAASWSVSSINIKMIKEIAPLLSRFDFVSVREKSGIKICYDLGVIAKWVPDPVFLLSPEDYRSIYKEYKFNLPTTPYLFLYLLGNESSYSIQCIQHWAKENNLFVCYVTANSNIDKFDKQFPSIPEWLFLIDNAKYILTNSFHCSVFSIIFNKQFAVIPLSGIHYGMNTRLESLWEYTNISPRLFIDNDFSILNEKYKITKNLNAASYFQGVL